MGKVSWAIKNGRVFRPNRKVDGPASPSCQDHSNKAEAALKGYDLKLERETAVQDLLSDLMHLCDRKGFDFDDVLRMAKNNYEAER